MSNEYSDEDAQLVRQKTSKIYERFKESDFFENMYKYCQRQAQSIVAYLGEFSYMYDLVFPEDWNIDRFLGQVYNIQRKCMFKNEFFKALPKVIYHFSKFCEANNIGTFSLDKIEEYNQDLKEGYYDDEFYDSWQEGSDARLENAKKWGL